jgi:hypothetical protein
MILPKFMRKFFVKPRTIAFIVHDPIMLVHYKDVWGELGNDSFLILLTENFAIDANGNKKLGVGEFLNYVKDNGYCVKDIVDVVSRGIKFDYTVTNHLMSGSTQKIKSSTIYRRFQVMLNQVWMLMGGRFIWRLDADPETYLPLQVGRKHVRYMYGADISEGWSLASWNNMYDVFLCHGVNDQQELKKRFKGEAHIMGYPRYDRFFSGKINLDSIRDEFKLSEKKKTMLWMPTLGGDYSSIPLFAKSLSNLSGKYNLIVRPHPFSFVQEKEFIEILQQYNFNIDRVAVRDMNDLFAISDIILADNGGTPFSAIFLGKNIIFLDVPENLGAAATGSFFVVDSSVMELKKYLPVVKPHEMSRLEELLDSDEFYRENSDCIDVLFKKYFDSPRGGGAKRAADILKSLQ